MTIATTKPNSRELVEYGRLYPQAFRLAIADMDDDEIQMHFAWIAAKLRQEPS